MKAKTLLLPLAVLTLYSTSLPAQENEPQLTATILHLDSAFWNAYNSCDTAHFIDFVTDDVEFYHDKGGVTTDAKSLISALNKNICGNTTSHLRREAIAGTVKVYPMKSNDKIYGAIITGEHSFYLTANGKPGYHTGDAAFTQLWILKNGVWKMNRILSYNHHDPAYKNNKATIDLAPKQLDAFLGNYKSTQSGTMTGHQAKQYTVTERWWQQLYPFA
ncbi:MAG: nuclear transport factor 2 family protein [Ginsengibacter sp.]